MAANKKPKAGSSSGENKDRPNGKAWKKNPKRPKVRSAHRPLTDERMLLLVEREKARRERALVRELLAKYEQAKAAEAERLRVQRETTKAALRRMQPSTDSSSE